MLSWQRHGVALTICELGNGTLSVPFQGSRADAKQMRGKRSSAVSTARDAVVPSAVYCGGMTEGVTASPQGAYASDRLTATAALFTPASPFPKKSFAAQNLFWEPYPISPSCVREGAERSEAGGL